MKRIWISITIFAIMIAGCIAESMIINKMTDKLYSDIEQAQQLVIDQNVQEAINLAKDIDSRWEKEDKVLGAFISHEILEDIEKSLTVMKVNLICEEYNDFFAESSRTLAGLQQLKDTELPKISNIL